MSILRPAEWWPATAMQCFDDLMTYRLVGASACADAILESLVQIANAVPDDADGISALAEARTLFLSLKPDTALYRNVIDIVLDREALPIDVPAHAARLAAYRRDAQRRVILAAAEYAAVSDSILVHDYSSATLRVLRALADWGSLRRVVVTECGFLGQGPRTASLIQQMGHRVAYTSDCSVGRSVPTVDLFITGVESFFADGSLSNTVGTLAIGLLCREEGIPVLAPAELLKLDRSIQTANAQSLHARLLRPWAGAEDPAIAEYEVDDHVLDAIPSGLVSTYATESGLLHPTDVGAQAMRVIESFYEFGAAEQRKES